VQSVLKRNNVNVIGSGEKVMLFAHGFGCDQSSWQFITSSFTKDYKLVLFDYVGSGKSDLSAYDDKKYNILDGYAEDVLDICNELNLKDVIFVGHSVSSMIGLLAAVKNPEFFKKMVFIGPSAKYLNEEEYIGGFEKADLESLFEFMDSNYMGWSRAMAPAIMGNPDLPEHGEFLANSFCSNNPEIARQFARVTFYSDNRADLKNLAIESLTLQCSEDIIAPVAVGEYIKANVKGNSMVILNATGHCPHISNPLETIRAIKDFIN